MPLLSRLHIIQARIALGLSQREFGDLVGSVKRTIQRWEGHGAVLLPSTVALLVQAIHPKDPELAARFAAEGDTSLLELGLVKPPAPPSVPEVPESPAPASPPQPPAAPAYLTATLVDAIVCAAAEAIGLPPGAVRPALAAAFERAREVQLDAGTVADSLREGAARGSRKRGTRAPA